MTDTNNKEETFQFVIIKCIEKARRGLEKEIFVYIKQLHDKEIKNEIMKSLEAQKYLNYIKNNEIKELQAEIERLKGGKVL